MKDEEQKEIIETLDENGKVVKFELYDIVEYDNKEYALLIPLNDDDDNEVVVMRLVEDENEEYSFEAIEDDDEFNAVSEFIESLED